MTFFEFRKYFGNVRAFRTRENCKNFAKFLRKCSEIGPKMAIFDYKTRSDSKIPNFFRVGTSCLSFFRKLGSERVSEIAVFRKLGSERVFRAFSELVPTRENSFRLETRLECSEKSSECRALLTTIVFVLPEPRIRCM